MEDECNRGKAKRDSKLCSLETGGDEGERCSHTQSRPGLPDWFEAPQPSASLAFRFLSENLEWS